MTTSKQPHFLSGSPIILLDSLRIVAAMTVCLKYLLNQWFSEAGYIHSERDYKHSAVGGFFVLPSYVIANTSTNNNREPLQYANAKLSRLYSLVLHAIFVTAVAQIITTYLSPSLGEKYSRGDSFLRYLFSAFFSSELWFHSTSPPINGPLWSLSFKLWYYAIFGAFFYRVRSWAGLLVPLAICIFVGLKILILMPIWIMGNLAYTLSRPNLSYSVRWGLVFIFLLTALVSIIHVPEYPFKLGMPPWFWSSMFLTDWLAGFFIALALWILPAERKLNKAEWKWMHIFRKMADLTFPIYVLHMPLLIAWRALFGTQYYNLSQMFAAFFSVLGACIILGLLFEKYRYLWSRLFTTLLSLVKHKTETLELRQKAVA